MAFGVGAAQDSAVTSEPLSFVSDGQPQRTTELTECHGPGPLTPVDLVTSLRSSRYGESHSLTPTAGSKFEQLMGHELPHAVTVRIWNSVRYVPGSGCRWTMTPKRCSWVS